MLLARFAGASARRAGDSDATALAEAEVEPDPTAVEPAAALTRVRNDPVAVLVHHDDPGEIDVDLLEERRESRELVLVLEEPLPMLEAEKFSCVPERFDPALVDRARNQGFVGLEDGREAECERLFGRVITLDLANVAPASLEIRKRGTLQGRNLDHDFVVHEAEAVAVTADDPSTLEELNRERIQEIRCFLSDELDVFVRATLHMHPLPKVDAEIETSRLCRATTHGLSPVMSAPRSTYAGRTQGSGKVLKTPYSRIPF